MPAGVTEGSVCAAAAEWLLLHACLRGEDTASPSQPVVPEVQPSGGANAVEHLPDHDLFGLLQLLMSPFGDSGAHQLQRVQPIGMADLPPEASPMQLYEWLAATDPLLLDLERLSAAMRRGSVLRVRSGFRGGVEAVRQERRAESEHAERSASQFTRVHRSMASPLVCKGWKRGDEAWSKSGSRAGAACEWGRTWGQEWAAVAASVQDSHRDGCEWFRMAAL